ncbi:Erf-like ssDNA annealing protein [Anabaena phage A-4L]|uniref:Recombination protein n=1 Tax=Anabaena phage A-4L TaxID=1357732 RepID=A0A059PYE0_9CAUD|nr:Erf-like ssDNA annealing protein [Anabaena phage A-4L]AGR48548.1 recombination protein [Anabaena phage A-4L]
MKELYTALLTAKSKFPKIIKNKTNPHFRNKYADLDSILDAVEKVLFSNGLFITQTIENYNLVTRIIHAETGQELKSSYPLPEGLDSQKFGGAITYARRYDLCALLSITADDDDDGNSAANDKPAAVGNAGSKPTTGYTRRTYGSVQP